MANYVELDLENLSILIEHLESKGFLYFDICNEDETYYGESNISCITFPSRFVIDKDENRYYEKPDLLRIMQPFNACERSLLWHFSYFYNNFFCERQMDLFEPMPLLPERPFCALLLVFAEETKHDLEDF